MSNLPNIYLQMANQSILPDCYAGATDSALWLYLKGKTLAEAVSIALEPNNTQHIEFRYGALKSVFEDYTQVKAIMDRGDQIEIMLTGGHVVKEDALDEGTVVKDGSDELSGGDTSES